MPGSRPRTAPIERLAALGTLVGGVAHEINNPLGYLLTNLGALERGIEALCEARAGYRAALERALGSGAQPLVSDLETKLASTLGNAEPSLLLEDSLEGALRIRDLVRDLLVLCRPDARDPAPICVNALLESTLRLVRSDLVRTATLDRELWATREVEGDPARLGQLFLNLLGNALAACSAEGGSRHRIAVRSRDTAEGVAVEVEDTGVGIPPEAAEHVFQPFWTTREAEGGTGLGLSISRHIAEDHGGTLEFRSTPGRATVFELRLPARAGAGARARAGKRER